MKLGENEMFDYVDKLLRDGMRLNHRLLGSLSSDIVESFEKRDLAIILDALEGSRVEPYLFLDDDSDSFYLRLCYNGKTHDVPKSEVEALANIAPFIATCAGKARKDRLNPSASERLQALEERVRHIEDTLKNSEE